MLRTLSAAVLFAIGASAAQAADVPAGELKLSYDASRLATDESRETLKQEVARTVDAYCRSRPVEGTVASCKSAMVLNAHRQIDADAHQYAQRQRTIELTDSGSRTSGQQSR